jgi:hypothetical protein
MAILIVPGPCIWDELFASGNYNNTICWNLEVQPFGYSVAVEFQA